MSDPARPIKSMAIRLRVAKTQAKKQALIFLKDFIVQMLMVRIRDAGQGLNGDLKSLSAGYINKRKSSNNLHSDTTPPTSNLTATGQMLDSMKAKISDGGITVTISGKRKNELSGAKSKLTNNQVRKYVEENGRPFFDLTKEERIELTKVAYEIIKDEITKAIKGT